VGEPNWNLLRKQSSGPNSQSGRNRRDYRGSRRCDGDEVGLRNGGDHGCHQEIVWIIGMVERHSYISQHHRACYSCGNSTTSEVTLRRDEWTIVVRGTETCFEPSGKVGGRFYLREVPEHEKCTPDLCIMLRAGLAFRDMPLHANQLDTGEGIIYEGNVLITKLATIHGDRLRVR